MATRAEIARAWATATGRPLDQLVLATAFGLFKIVVIAQQIYVRYAKGLTTDPRFGVLPQVIAALARRAEQTLDKSSV
jgi:aminoglycoside phosphotransferase (APT) family kinase protein